MGAGCPRRVGRYVLHGTVGAGATATVHVGRLLGPVGFARTVAIKRLHERLSREPDFVAMFLDEARLTSRIRHPNVVPTLDVVNEENELFLVMEYVHGESLARLCERARARGEAVPPPIAASILAGVLHGLHAAHEARTAGGKPLDIVHRDVSPQNILVGVDGAARVLDFGVAKATERVHATRDGRVKGKLAYMAPEQFRGQPTRRSDVYGAAVVLWEALTGRRLFAGESDTEIAHAALSEAVTKPSAVWPWSETALAGVDVAALDAAVLRGTHRDPHARFATARDMAKALEECVHLAPPRAVGDWVRDLAQESLAERALLVAAVEELPVSHVEPERAQSGPVAAPHPAAPATRRPASRRWLMALALPLVALIALRGRSGESAARVAPASASTAPAEHVEAVAPAVPAPAPEPVAEAPAPAPREKSKPPSARAVTAPPPPAKPRRKERCDPPYVFDAAGRKEFKVECLN